jgi:hypothetical protein
MVEAIGSCYVRGGGGGASSRFQQIKSRQIQIGGGFSKLFDQRVSIFGNETNDFLGGKGQCQNLDQIGSSTCRANVRKSARA